MNKCYTKVWNASLGQVVVASEFASGDTVVGSSGGKSPRSAFGAAFAVNVLALALAAAGATGLTFMAAPAFAADAVCVDPVTGLPVGTATNNSVACGDGAVASGGNSVAIGNGATAGKVDGAYNGTSASQPLNTIAIGNNAQASSGSSVAIGDGAKTYQGLGDTVDPDTGVLYPTNYGIAIGAGATAIGSNTVIGSAGNFDINGTTVQYAAGKDASNYNINNSVIGNGAGINMRGRENVVMGYRAGYNASSFGGNVFIGRDVAWNSTAADSIAIGHDAGQSAQGSGNIAIGGFAGANVQRIDSLPVGSRPTGCSWTYYCPGNAGDGINNVALGEGAGRNLKGAVTVGIGFQTLANSVGVLNTAVGGLAGANSVGIANVWMGPESGRNTKGN